MKQMGNYVGVVGVRDRNHGFEIDEVKKNTVVLNSNGSNYNGVFYIKEQTEEKEEEKEEKEIKSKVS